MMLGPPALDPNVMMRYLDIVNYLVEASVEEINQMVNDSSATLERKLDRYKHFLKDLRQNVRTRIHDPAKAASIIMFAHMVTSQQLELRKACFPNQSEKWTWLAPSCLRMLCQQASTM